MITQYIQIKNVQDLRSWSDKLRQNLHLTRSFLEMPAVPKLSSNFNDNVQSVYSRVTVAQPRTPGQAQPSQKCWSGNAQLVFPKLSIMIDTRSTRSFRIGEVLWIFLLICLYATA